jgi:hypothetical protein
MLGEQELVMAHRALIKRIREFGQRVAFPESLKISASQQGRFDKKGQGFLF